MNSNDAGDSYFVPTGGVLVDKGKMYALQMQYWSPIRKRGKVTYGIDGIFTRPNTEYTLHGRFEDQDNINEFGTYFQGDYEVLPRLTMLVASRIDYHNIINKVFVSPVAHWYISPAPGTT